MKILKSKPFIISVILIIVAIIIVVNSILIYLPGSPQRLGNGNFAIRNQQYNTKYLRPEAANKEDGTRMVLDSPRPWKCFFWKFNTKDGETFNLENIHTGKEFIPLESENDISIIQKQKTTEEQAWIFEKKSDGIYSILEIKSKKYLTAKKLDDGTIVLTISPWKDTDDQKWQFLNSPIKIW